MRCLSFANKMRFACHITRASDEEICLACTPARTQSRGRPVPSSGWSGVSMFTSKQTVHCGLCWLFEELEENAHPWTVRSKIKNKIKKKNKINKNVLQFYSLNLRVELCFSSLFSAVWYLPRMRWPAVPPACCLFYWCVYYRCLHLRLIAFALEIRLDRN